MAIEEQGPTLDRIENALWKGQIGRREFVRLAAMAGMALATAQAVAAEVDTIKRNQQSLAARLTSAYDFIVCGAGTAGCIVARRLAENPNIRVLLLEAGGSDDRPIITTPQLWPTTVGTDVEWGYWAQHNPALNGRSIREPMGKVLGGGSSINALVWARGHKNDYNSWAEITKNPDWGYDHALEIFKRIEDWQGPADPTRRGTGGLLWVEPSHDPLSMAHAYVKAADSLGIPAFDDMNGAMMEGPGGAAIANLRIRDGRRVNMATSYLRPILTQPNLTVLTGADVHRIKLRGKRATGVVFSWGDRIHDISVTREVVMTMGAIQTPLVLMHSGIGDQAELRRVGLAVAHHLPGVGRNLRDHTMTTGVMWEPKEEFQGRNNLAEACFFWKSEASLATPDLQFWQIELPFVNEMTGPRFNAPRTSWSISPCVVRPNSESTGEIKLRSKDRKDGFAIYANHLKDERDVRAAAFGVELAREVGNSPIMKDFVKREVGVQGLRGAELQSYVRDATVSYFHAACTCRMGHDEMAVVDDQLKVRGIDGLRIADGSAMPDVTTGNIMAGVVIVAERMGEILTKTL